MRIVTIVNQKGGCGKTTTAINLAAVFAKRGLRTLIVDLDPQSHCAAGLGIPEQRIDLDIGDVMLMPTTRPIDTARLLWRAGKNLDLAPSRMKLAGLEASRGGLADKPDKERRLASVLERIQSEYDVAIVDCSPAIGLLTFNALAAATCVVIPVETSFFSLQGATKQVNTVRTLAKRLGVELPVWLLATIHDEASSVSRDLLDELRRRFPTAVIPTIIRRDPKLREAASFGQAIVDFAPTSSGAADYAAAAQWLAEHLTLTLSPAADHSAELFATSAPIQPVLGGQTPIFATEPPAAPTAAPHVSTGPSGTDLAAALRASFLAPTSETREVTPDHKPMNRAAELVFRAQKLLRRVTASEPPAVPVVVTTPPTVPVPVIPEPAPEAISPTPGAPLRLAEALEIKLPKATEMDRRLLGVRQTSQGVLFVQPLSLGQRVYIAGTFNHWSPSATPMTRNEGLGVHEICIPIDAGDHQYRLVVDGAWTADPHNAATATNPFGELNSVVHVAALGSQPIEREVDQLLGARRDLATPLNPPTILPPFPVERADVRTSDSLDESTALPLAS